MKNNYDNDNQPFEEEDVDVMEEEEIDAESIVSLENHLVIYDDNVNTFENVESALQEICGHTVEQSMQCTMIVHNNGKCSVKQGSYKKLKPMLEEILYRKIIATIE